MAGNNSCRFFWIGFMLLATLVLSHAVPAVMISAEADQTDLSEIGEELVLDEDDSTTHTLERLVSAATCLVAGVEYTHGQQIYRPDPCEFCLCLDGEMFCWWQDCPPVAIGPCKDRRPFSACANGKTELPLSQTYSQQPQKPTQQETTNTVRTSSTPAATTDAPTTVDLDTWSTENGSASEMPSGVTEGAPTEHNATQGNGELLASATHPSTSNPATCVVMGVEYKIGEMLPHATGNCLECICGSGARVTCSPHLCAPPEDDTADYRSPELRPDLPDAF